MARLKGRIVVFLLAATTLFEAAAARLINTTIYDTNLGHVAYEPKNDFCTEWRSSWVFWKTCAAWAQPWKSTTYHSQGRFETMHSSLNHQLPSVTVEFEGLAIWLYGPPRAQLAGVPPDYKICLYENHRLASDEVCYHVDVAEAYLSIERYDEPVVIFAKGGLQHQRHRVVVSVGDPIDNTQVHHGIQFSHAVYTIERPTPWPIEEDHWRFRQVLMHDTHPLLSYYPMPRCSSPWCPGTGWMSKTYRAEDGTVVSWHELKSRDEWNKELWGVETAITAGAVAIYSIPKAHITGTDFLSHICVHIDFGDCEIVDVQHAYLNSEHHHESVLLW
ncbi:hypothetical protein FRC08_014716 [Ceratobasidium sp. 394]|nr:hypothetical protein FRC08_014716 [Ceratobasidium sp. 394]